MIVQLKKQYCSLLLLQQPFYDTLDFVQNNLAEPVPEETFTHSHLSWSSIIPYLLLPPFMIHGILFVQFTCLTVLLHSRSPSFLWSTSWPGTLHFILHTFLHEAILFQKIYSPIIVPWTYINATVHNILHKKNSYIPLLLTFYIVRHHQPVKISKTKELSNAQRRFVKLKIGLC